MRFDETIKLFNKEQEEAQGRETSPAAAPPETSSESSLAGAPVSRGLKSGEVSVEIKVGDKQSFEQLLKDQIQLHEVSAASWETPIVGNASATAAALACAELEEIRQEVEAAFEEMGDEAPNWDRPTPVIGAADEAPVTASGASPAQPEANAAPVAAAELEVEIEIDDADRDTVKPERPEALNASESSGVGESAAEGEGAPDGQDDGAVENSEDRETIELAPEDLLVVSQNEQRQKPESDTPVRISYTDVVLAEERATTEVLEAEVMPDVADEARISSLLPQPEYAILLTQPFIADEEEDDGFPSVRTSMPLFAPEELAPRRRNYWKSAALISMALLMGIIGWMGFQHRAALQNAFPFLQGNAGGSGLAPRPAAGNSNDDATPSEGSQSEQMAAALPDPDASTAAITAHKKERTKDQRASREESSATRKNKGKSDSPASDRRAEGAADAADDEASNEVAAADDTPAAASGPSAAGVVSDAIENAPVAPSEVIAHSAIPKLPSKAAVRMAMADITPSVRHCKMETSGKLIVQMVVSGATGKVISATVVDDTFKGSFTGLCAARVVQTATFPQFQQDQLIIKYPFTL